jgi:hypothetical protein
MGIFNLFKKKEVSPIPPPGDISNINENQNVKPPINFPEQDYTNNNPFENDQNLRSTSNQNDLNEIPLPPKFESMDDSHLNETSQPFNPNVPDFNDSINNNLNQPNQKGDDSNLPNPFESNLKQPQLRKLPTFAERFGTLPNEEPINNVNESDDNLNKENNFINQSTNENINYEENDKDFSFENSPEINKSKLLSKNELPLHDDLDHPFDSKIDEHVEEKINENISSLESKKEINNEKKSDESVEYKNETLDDEKKLRNSIHKIGSSIFLSVDDCREINVQITDLKLEFDNYKTYLNKVSDLEKNSETHYNNWKKSIESINSLLLSIDKKVFR